MGWKISSILVKILFVFGVILIALAYIGPPLIKSLNLKSEKVDISFTVPVINEKINLKGLDISKKNQTIMLGIGGAALVLSVAWALINLKPHAFIANIRNKDQIKSELSKMNQTLEGIKKIGSS